MLQRDRWMPVILVLKAWSLEGPCRYPGGKLGYDFVQPVDVLPFPPEMLPPWAATYSGSTGQFPTRLKSRVRRGKLRDIQVRDWTGLPRCSLPLDRRVGPGPRHRPGIWSSRPS